MRGPIPLLLATALAASSACKKDAPPTTDEPAADAATDAAAAEAPPLTDEAYLALWARHYELDPVELGAEGYATRWAGILAEAGTTEEAFDAHAEKLAAAPERVRAIVLERLGSDWNPVAVAVFAAVHELVAEECATLIGELLADEAERGASRAAAGAGGIPDQAEMLALTRRAVRRGLAACGGIPPDLAPEPGSAATPQRMPDDRYLETWLAQMVRDARPPTLSDAARQAFEHTAEVIRCRPDDLRPLLLERLGTTADVEPDVAAVRSPSQTTAWRIFRFAAQHRLVDFACEREQQEELDRRMERLFARPGQKRRTQEQAVGRFVRTALDECLRRRDAAIAAADERTDDEFAARLIAEESERTAGEKVDEGVEDPAAAAAEQAVFDEIVRRLRCDPPRARALLFRHLDDEALEARAVFELARLLGIASSPCGAHFELRARYVEATETDPAPDAARWREVVRETLDLCGVRPDPG